MKGQFFNLFGKLVHPKIHKNGPNDSTDYNGAAFVIFWMNQYFPSSFLKDTDFNTDNIRMDNSPFFKKCK